MIDNRLLIQDAKAEGIKVSEDEIMEYAMQTKEVLEQNSILCFGISIFS